MILISLYWLTLSFSHNVHNINNYIPLPNKLAPCRYIVRDILISYNIWINFSCEASVKVRCGLMFLLCLAVTDTQNSYVLTVFSDQEKKLYFVK